MSKLAFSTNQYSGYMNPIIRSGASDLPPFQVPGLRRPLQKNSGAITPFEGPDRGDLAKVSMAAFVDEVLTKLGVNVGQWWEQVGGPHLAKGGSHAEFKKMMMAEGIPEGMQKKFLDLAKEKYKPGYNTGHGHAAAAGAAKVTKAMGGLTPETLGVAGSFGSLLGGAKLIDTQRDPKQPSWKGRLGAHLMTTVPLAIQGQDFGRWHGKPWLGGLVGAGAGALMGEALHHRIQSDRGKQKTAAGAPTRGNFMMASDLPPWQEPQLQRGIQKNSGETSMPTGTAGTGSTQLESSAGPSPTEVSRKQAPAKVKTDAFLPDGITYSPGDFKRSKYAMPTEQMSLFVAELRKQAEPGLTPASRLAQTASVGAPKVTAPPGPSIADIAKPKGAHFGVGIPGAFKGSIGGMAPVSLK